MNSIEQKAAGLVAQMTLEEKVHQMVHAAAAVERLDIPSYNWWGEALHGVARAGVATMFPQAIALAATFDEALLYEVADVIATEGRAKYHAFQREGDHDIYKGLTFWSPNVNIFRDPRWGRGHETYGEDPWLTSRLGVAYIKGLQGDDPQHLKAAACAKHFAVHSGPEELRHEFDAVCDDYDLWNTYLPAFEAAVVDGGVEAVMGAYNAFRGAPCNGSKLLLQDILRDKWGFEGHVVSDCWAIKDFHEHHKVTKTPTESVAMAVDAGCDINCGSMFYHVVNAVEKGLLREEQVDMAVTRLFATRMKLGLLGGEENPAYTSIPYEVVDSPAHNALNLEASRRSLVLLKNDGVLPLDMGALKTVGVIGPNADSRRALEGNYEGSASRHITPLAGIQELADAEGVRVLYAEGCHLFRDKMADLSQPDDRIAEARAVARHSDVVVLCLGLDADIEGEEGDEGNQFAAGDKNDLALPGRQQLLLENVVQAANGKPVVVVLLSGSALAVDYADTHTNAVLQAFYPGSYGGRAIAEALFGHYSPEGKLPVTFYRADEKLPDFCDYSMENRTYRYFTGEALYPFGFGLGYASFEVSALQVGDMQASGSRCSLTVRNTGGMAARETVQVYVQSPGQKERHSLCGVVKVCLQPGEAVEVHLVLRKKVFSRYDANGDLQLVRGTHKLFVGFCQPDARSVQLYGQKPLEAEVRV